VSLTLDVEWNGDRIILREAGQVIAGGRWASGRIVDRCGTLGDGSDGAWEALEVSLREESEALIRATTDAAYDRRGVDITQIDRMLSLSPLERLQALDAQRRSIARLVGDVPRD
jgi:hypothetical protein